LYIALFDEAESRVDSIKKCATVNRAERLDLPLTAHRIHLT
jgi:hypothetical protein